MFGDLPKLLDRDFLIGYYLPSIVYLGGTIFLAVFHGFMDGTWLWEFLVGQLVLATAIVILLVWLFAISLLAFNGSLYRLKEGYPFLDLLKPLTQRRRREFQELQAQEKSLAQQRREKKKKGEPVPPELVNAGNEISKKLACHWPPVADWVLPFRFGNTVRAFEVYSYVMYGLDATTTWSRLLMVVPKEYRELVDEAKSHVDFLLNLWAVWWLLLLEHLGCLFMQQTWKGWWLALIAVFSLGLASSLARGAVVRWGEMVRATFDMFLPALEDRLGLPHSTSRQQALWDRGRLSWALEYRQPDGLPRWAVLDGQEPPHPASPTDSGDKASGLPSLTVVR